MPTGATKAKSSVSYTIEAALLNEISTGSLEAGERLDETKLANRFGASRTPVREALSRLKAQGVLEAAEGRGVQVAQYSRETLAQMFEAMHEIEALCAKLVAQRLTLFSKARLEAAQSRCREAASLGDRARYLEANEALHFEIYAATGNPFIQQMAGDFRRRTGPFRAKKFASEADLVASAESHEELLKRIFSADSDDAFDFMRRHMEQSFLSVLAAE
ncbi:MAG: GntR family transcriptional regulator [Pseudomonadota bacterium]